MKLGVKMREDKAYKLLALQEGISNNKAKELIDLGIVYVHGEKLAVARTLVDVGVKFKIAKREVESLIHEDEEKVVLNKPAFITTENLAKKYNLTPLHRLDKETSGVLILTKDEEFRLRAIEEFRKMRVEKIYYAIVYGKVAEDFQIDTPILTTKTPNGAISKTSQKGKEAISLIEPIMMEGRYTLVKVSIKTGRTHQIRVHLQSSGYPILGDLKYGRHKAERLMLHSSFMKIFNQEFKSPLPSIFRKYGFSW